jgi:large subunit ribosomal protein L4
MPQITLKNAAGKDAGTVDLDDATFGIQPNVPVMHQVVTAQLAARRAGTQSTKTRSTVRGGGRKPFRQKGTGNARQGSTRSPQFTGGAVALGPQPRKYDQKTPKKMISLALRSALSDRAAEGKVVVIDSWGWDKPSTKSAVKALAGLGVEGRVLVVVGRDDAAAALSFRNVPEVQLIAPGELNAYDVLCNDYVVFTQNLLPVFTGSAKSAAAPGATAKVEAVNAEAVEPEAVEQAAVEAEAVEPEVVEQDAAVEQAAVEQAAVEVDEWAGSAKPLADGSTPAGFDIKGNKDSMLYHVPGSRFYKQTKAEVWFDSEQSAEAAGFSKPASQQAAENEAETAAENEESE